MMTGRQKGEVCGAFVQQENVCACACVREGRHPGLGSHAIGGSWLTVVDLQ